MNEEPLPPLLDRNLVVRAIGLVQPGIEGALRSDATNRAFLYVVVTGLSPLNPLGPGDDFEASCYLVAAIGDTSDAVPRFRRMALSKAERTVRTGRVTAELPPHYLRPGDTTSWGSVVLDDIVVACSGVQSFYDEMFAMWIAAAVKAESKRVYEEHHRDRRFV